MSPSPLLVLLLSQVVILGSEVVFAQDYPSRPIRIVTAEVGGGTDLTARLIAQGISSTLGQQVIVDNRASAVMPTIVSNAPANGYSLLLTGQALWLGPLL